MTRDAGPALWANKVIVFIERNIPKMDDTGDWHHVHITAYQIGCEALAALGQAVEKEWGARPLAEPRLPAVLPRWDDICAAVLNVADQNGLIAYRRVNGVEAATRPARRSREQEALLPPPNILPSHGLGPARADLRLMPALLGLGLVKDGEWAACAEVVLWREQPDEWALTVTTDPRIADAVERAVTVIPSDIHTEMTRLATITEADIARIMARRRPRHDRLQAEAETNGSPIQPLSARSVRDRLVFVRRYALDVLFFDNWRLSDGWLTPLERSRALAIFHDPLAIQMRCAVVQRLYPNEPGLAK